jgi:L,D-transpeptidase catalytic domain
MTNGISRRFLITSAIAAVVATSIPAAAVPETPLRLDDDVLTRARATFMRHRDKFAHYDRIGIADFSRPSSEPRLFIVDMIDGRSSAYLVAHGRGSDLAHTGWVQRFSNRPGSFASSDGAYATSDYYNGCHGRSMRLIGLDADNSNAASRDIVVHGARYVTPEIARATGKLGRSEGCFAVSYDSLDEVLRKLGPGRLLYADKLRFP